MTAKKKNIMIYKQTIWYLSKRKIEPKKKGEIFYIVQYYFQRRRYRTYYGASTKEAARALFKEDYGSDKNPVEIHDIKPMKGDDNASVVAYTHVMELVDTGYKLIDAFISVGRTLGISAKAVESRFYRLKKESKDD